MIVNFVFEIGELVNQTWL